MIVIVYLIPIFVNPFFILYGKGLDQYLFHFVAEARPAIPHVNVILVMPMKSLKILFLHFGRFTLTS